MSTGRWGFPLRWPAGLAGYQPVWLQRDLSQLPTDGRPLSQTGKLEAMYEVRRPLYERFADVTIDNNGPLEDAVNAIKEALL